MSRLGFVLEKEAAGSQARAAHFQTLHGEVKTPIFMPVGTQATVKSQTVASLKTSGSRVLLANTYHLLLRPGVEVFKKFGGIHRFMNWDGPVLTDSGGFQIFSLPGDRVMTEDGASFQSYIDGKTFLLSPETSIETQKAIGSDIMMVLDQCIPSTAPHAEALEAMELTHRWAVRSLAARGDSPQSVFGIVQGACHRDLREKSAEFLRAHPFDGLAIGGLAVGETQEERTTFTALVTSYLPKNLPRYLMGVGTPIDLLEAVHRGVDMFDCIIPSQMAQRGVAFTTHGRLQFRRSIYKFLEEPVDADCPCLCCREYSRAYIHHLIKANEYLGWHLLTTHNLTFYHRLMAEIREKILAGDFVSFYEKKRKELIRTDVEIPGPPPRKKSPPKPAQLGDYEVQLSPQGFSSIKQISSGEVMHSVSDPSVEANRLYIDQSQLAEKLLDAGGNAEELVIWDVGLGAATNAMAAVFAFEKTLSNRGADAMRPLRIVSFECDLDPLRLAVREAVVFPHLHHGAPSRILELGEWKHASKKLHWTLHEGDFLKLFEGTPVPDLIFYDPFSYKTDGGLWKMEVFEKIFKYCSSKQTALFTYSASTTVRVALLAAGFFVAEGVGTGPKSSTTIAFNKLPVIQDEKNTPRLLGAEWLERWKKSSSRYPAGLLDEDRTAFDERIVRHGQFGIDSRPPLISPKKGS